MQGFTPLPPPPPIIRGLVNWLLVASFTLLGVNAQAVLNAVDQFNFTKLDVNGNVLPVTVTDHACVKDNVTGLVWEVKANDGGLRDRNRTYTFDSAAQFANDVNAAGGLCGFTDWRVPNPQELVGIVNYSTYSPKIDTNFFPDTSWGDYYWTTFGHYYGNVAWTVDFDMGYVDPCYRDANFAVRLVRGKSNGSGLIWGESLYGMTWEQSFNAAKNSTFNGYNDWRVPNVKEMQSILSYNNAPIWMPSDSLCGFYDSGYINSSERDDANLRTLWLVRDGLPVQPDSSLSSTKAGNGTGTVTSNPAGIDCGGNCSANFAQNAVVTLAATPSANSTFAGWSGDADCSDGQVTMDTAKNCIATFKSVSLTASVKEGYGCVGNAIPVSSGVPVQAYEFSGWQAYCIYVPYGASLGISMTIYEPNSYFDLSVNGADGRDYFCDGTYCSFTTSTGGMWRFIVTGAYAYSGVPFAVTATVDLLPMPTVITDEATNITDTSAVLNGSINPNGQSIWPWFSVYDLNQNYYGIFPVTEIPANYGVISVNADATGLNCDTTYNYRIVAETYQLNTIVGEEKSFTTVACPAVFTVTPIVGTGGMVNPSTPQTVNSGDTISFTATPDTGYIINSTVGGTCPQGNWSGNVWTTGSITDNCTVNFSFTKTYVVTPIIGPGCAVNPNTPQTVSLGNTTSFTVTPNPGYAINPGVRGTCPQGSWNGNVWTTGAITANCTVNLYCTQIPKPDFTITGITLTPASPNAGGNFSAAVTVKNQSTTGAGDAGQLTIWTNQPTVQTCGAVGDQTVTVGPLATGEVKTITFTGLIANNSLNTQTFRAFIDSGCITAETNETNNQFTKTYRPTGVDLVVTSIALSPTSPLANSLLIKATVTIKNQGNIAAYAGYLDVWANKSTPASCGDDGDAWAEVGTVAANTTKTLILNIPIDTAGSKTARAFIDSWCGTPETVETNNQFTKVYTVR